jgi:hypothetical protein
MTFDLSTINFETATCRDLAALPALAPRSHDNLFFGACAALAHQVLCEMIGWHLVTDKLCDEVSQGIVNAFFPESGIALYVERGDAALERAAFVASLGL